MKNNFDTKAALSIVAVAALVVGLLFFVPGVFANGSAADLYDTGTGTPGASGTAQPGATGLPATGANAAGPTTYTVKAGDTLGGIALAFRVTVISLLQANSNVTDPNLILIGEQLNIPAPNLKAGQSVWAGFIPASAGLPSTGGTLQPSATATAGPGATATGLPATGGSLSGPATFVVQSGDTLGAIAQAYSVTVVSLLRANPDITDPNLIFIGEQIAVPAPNLTGSQSIWAGFTGTTTGGTAQPSSSATPQATPTP